MIDSRFFSFGEFTLPKTKSMNQVNYEVAVGYFDIVNVEEININERYYNPIDQHLMGYFDKLHSTKGEEISKQNLYGFTNIDESEYFEETKYAFSKKKLDRFWHNDNTDYNRFYSLLHINVNSEEDINNMLKWLNGVFNSDKNSASYSAVFYFSFDYSDIIICAKNMSVTEYTKKIFDINYSTGEGSYSACIKDSFSLLVLNKSFIQNVFEIMDECSASPLIVDKKIKSLFKNCNPNILNENLNIVYNIGVQDTNLFKCFCNELENCGIVFECFNMLGRHDVTLQNTQADLIWFLKLLYFVDKYSSQKSEHQTEKLLFNCESFISVHSSTDTAEISISSYDKTQNLRYTKAKKILDEKVLTVIENSSKEFAITEVHKGSLYSFSESIASIFKNRFADDFLVCIYEAFVSFLDYLNSKSNEKDELKDSKEFIKVFDRFFEIISALVNSAMHSERQFIQTPSFNPVFYDVPPKLLAFYTVITTKIKELNKGDNSNAYSFVFKPSFSKNISVFPYSYTEKPPADRLLAVSINEECLYKPTNVINVMCHEVAHYVGDFQRCRDIRKKYWTKAILFIAFKIILTQDIDSPFNKYQKADHLLDKIISDILCVIEQQNYYMAEGGYSEDFKQFTYRIFRTVCTNSKIESILKKHLLENFSNIDFLKYIKDIKENIHLLARFFPKDKTSVFKTNFFIVNSFFEYYQTLVSVFSEAYADIQMIFLANLSFEEYIKNLVIFENVTIEEFLDDSKFYRLFSVAYTLYTCRYWDISSQTVTNKKTEQANEQDKIMSAIKSLILWQNENSFSDTKKHYKEYNIDFIQIDEHSEKSDILTWLMSRKEPYVVNMFFSYLHDVIIKTQSHYKNGSKKELQIKLNSKIKQLENFDDATKIFFLVQSTNEEYLNKLITQQSKDYDN